MVWNGVVSPAAAAKYGKDFRNHPVGSGPFIFREWRSRDSITLDANPAYWNGRPHVDHLIFKEYPDPQAALLALKRGDIQILGDVSATVLPALQADKSIKLLTQPGLALSGMGMPTDTPPFDNQMVRQALNYAVDRNAINKALFKGFAVPMVSPMPASEWSFQPQQPAYTYNPEMAKKLLAQAGVKTPLSIELLTYNTPRGYNPAGRGPGGGGPGLPQENRHQRRSAQAGHGGVPVHGAQREIPEPVHDRLDRRQRRP